MLQHILLISCALLVILESTADMPAIFLILLLLPFVAGVGSFDFFYFVQQWPGSLCDGEGGCCFPEYGIPPNEFAVAGLYPARGDGSMPTFCDRKNPFDRSNIVDLFYDLELHWPALSCPGGSDDLRHLAREWAKHGTCSESVLGQRTYFAAALRLREQIDLIGVLRNAGINADGGFYYLRKLRVAIQEATGGLMPGFMCNTDGSGEVQLEKVILCADSVAGRFVNCPVFPKSNCLARVKFPLYFYAPRAAQA